MRTSSLSWLITEAYPELTSEEGLFEKATADLYNEGLVSSKDVYLNMSAEGAFEKLTRPIGDQFLNFISAPAT